MTIQHKLATVTNGVETISWTTSVTGPLFGAARWMRGRELEAMRQRWARADFVIELDFLDVAQANVQPLDRVLYGSRIFEIDGAEDPDGRLRRFQIAAHELT